MSEELKPCPFCGSTDLYVVQARIEEYHSVEPEISCKKCRYTIKLKELTIAVDESPETNADWWDRGTAKKWNTRPAEDALKEKLHSVKAALIYNKNLATDTDRWVFDLCDALIKGINAFFISAEKEGEDE